MYVVTGITRMNSGICVSVYDLYYHRYLRPIPPSGRFQKEDVANVHLFSVVNLQEDNRNIEINAPHNEDFPVVNTRLTSIRELKVWEQINLLRQISSSSVYDIFGYDKTNVPFLVRGYNERYYVVPGNGNGSLGTVQAKFVRVYRYANPYNDRIEFRVDFKDKSGNLFTRLKCVAFYPISPMEIYATNGVEIYIRLSLSRSFQPNSWSFPACFLQVSSVHVYPYT